MKTDTELEALVDSFPTDLHTTDPAEGKDRLWGLIGDLTGDEISRMVPMLQRRHEDATRKVRELENELARRERAAKNRRKK